MTTNVGRAPHLTRHEARQRLEHERGSRLSQLRAIEESAPHADKDLQDAQTVAIKRVLGEIEAAGERLENGSYGTCDSCRTAIPVERLEILPYVRFCVACQQRVS
jgi:RNA polymerase-binding transcription factor DksA